MSENRFTPGPWTVEHYGGPWHLFGAGDERIGTFSTAVPAFSPEHFAKAEANAHLIAAAFDMYAAIDGSLEYLRLTLGPCDPDCDCIIHRLEAAIAKAEGRQT